MHTATNLHASGDLIVSDPFPFPNPKSQPEGKVICKMGWDFDGDCNATERRIAGPEMFANQARLVACWNACQGIPTEALNAGVVGNAIAELKGVARVYDRDNVPAHQEERKSGYGVRPHILLEQMNRIRRVISAAQ